MCRNIKILYNFDPPASDQEIYASSLQFIRKVSGFRKPSKINQAAARLEPNDNSVPSAELKNSAENIKNTIQEKPETAGATHVTDLTPNKHPKPLKAEDESQSTYQDAIGIESLALLSPEKVK